LAIFACLYVVVKWGLSIVVPRRVSRENNFLAVVKQSNIGLIFFFYTRLPGHYYKKKVHETED